VYDFVACLCARIFRRKISS